MIDMALLSIIRRWHFRDEMPIREISRRTGLSRNTVRKYLRGGTVEPKFKVPERPSKLAPYAEKLALWLRANTTKSRKYKRTAKTMYADLVKLGYDGAYGRVAAFVREWKADRLRELGMSGRGTYVPLVFQPGEAFQFDWSEDWAMIGGERVKLQVAHTKLSHSKAFTVRGYPLQTHEMLFDALGHAFRVLGGVPGRGIFDNMKTAVDQIGTGKARQVNKRFAAMASHYLFEPDFCNPASGWEKGQIEKNVQDSRRRFWQSMPAFPDIDAMNAWLEEQCVEAWSTIPHGTLPGMVAEVWAAEKESLMPLGRLFDGFVEHTKRVSPTCLVCLERNRYSVPASFANRPVSVRVYPYKIVIAAEGRILCEHVRRIDRSHLPGRTIYDWRLRVSPCPRHGSMLVIWPSSNANRAHYVMARHLRRCPMPSGGCKAICSSDWVATGRWSTSSRWCCNTMNSLCSAPLRWRWMTVFPPRPISSICCTGWLMVRHRLQILMRHKH